VLLPTSLRPHHMLMTLCPIGLLGAGLASIIGGDNRPYWANIAVYHAIDVSPGTPQGPPHLMSTREDVEIHVRERSVGFQSQPSFQISSGVRSLLLMPEFFLSALSSVLQYSRFAYNDS
jgi:hypothetical protein